MIALLLLASAATAQLPENLPPLSANGGFIGASVADVDSSAIWYARLLDLKIVLRPPEREGRRMVALEGAGMLIELIEERDALPLAKVAPSVGRDYLVYGIFKGGFLVSDWNALLKRLKALEIPIAIGPFEASVEQRANLMILDPDGNFIQFFGDYAVPRR